MADPSARHRFELKSRDSESGHQTIGESDDELFFKGLNEEKEEFVVDLDELERKIAELRKVSDTPTDSLSSPLDDYHEEIRSVVMLLDGTDVLEEIRAIVTRHFGDVKKVIPGTVGAYFVACDLVKDGRLGDASCGLCTRDSFPSREASDKDENWSFCRDTVIHARLDDDDYAFFPLNHYRDSTRTIILLPESSYDSFPGFSEAEKRFLKARYNADKVRLIGYNPSGSEYGPLIEQTLALSDIKTRDCSAQSRSLRRQQRATTRQQSGAQEDRDAVTIEGDSFFWGFGFLILFFLMLFVFATWHYWYYWY